MHTVASRNLHHAPQHPRSGLWVMQRTQSRRTFSSHLRPFGVDDALDETPQPLRIIWHLESLLLCGVITASYRGAWLMDAATTVVHRVSRGSALQGHAYGLARRDARDRERGEKRRQQS